MHGTVKSVSACRLLAARLWTVVDSPGTSAAIAHAPPAFFEERPVEEEDQIVLTTKDATDGASVAAAAGVDVVDLTMEP